MESCSCSSCLSTLEIVGPRSRELGSSGTRSRGRGQTTASYSDCTLTGTLSRGLRDYYDMRYAIRYGSRECDMRCEYVSGRANANTLRAARMRYAICEQSTGRANAICDTRIGCARYGNTLWAARIRYAMREYDMRSANRPRATCNRKVASSATIQQKGSANARHL